MSSTPDSPDSSPTEPTRPEPTPDGATPAELPTQPLPSQQRAAHPTNPFLPPHPAAPADLRAEYDAQQRAAAGRPAEQYPPQIPPQVPPGQGGATPAAWGQQPPGPPPERHRAVWIPVTAAAAGAALLAALGTAGALGAFSDDSTTTTASSLDKIGQTSSESVPVAGSSAENPDWEKVAAAVQASVVAIEVTTSSGGGQGSGVILDDAGNILTNNHVVSGAQGDVQVTLTDGRLFDATIIGTDAPTDLAVIRLKDAPDDLSPASLGNSTDVRVGQAVMAVGNPLGLANTVTTGIVSAVDRPVSTSEGGGAAAVTNAIQIDAAINPGNSGGPLFDAQGRVIGITSSIATLSSSSGSIGLGFAIPINLAQDVADQLVEDGTAEHAFLGVTLSDGTATADGTTRRGATVETVSDGSPASEAGLQSGDVIVAIDDKPVGSAEALQAYVRELPAGTEVTLTVVRGDEVIDVQVTLATRVEQPTSGQTVPGDGQTTPGGEGQGAPGGGANPFGSGELTPEQLWQWYEQQQGRG